MRQTKAKVKARNSVKRKRVRSKSNKPGRRTKRKLRGGHNISDFEDLGKGLKMAEEHNFKNSQSSESLSN